MYESALFFVFFVLVELHLQCPAPSDFPFLNLVLYLRRKLLFRIFSYFRHAVFKVFISLILVCQFRHIRTLTVTSVDLGSTMLIWSIRSCNLICRNEADPVMFVQLITQVIIIIIIIIIVVVVVIGHYDICCILCKCTYFTFSLRNYNFTLLLLLSLLSSSSSLLIDNFDFCYYYYLYHNHHYSDVTNCLGFVLCMCSFHSCSLGNWP
jgi:hypothetical protein